MGYTQNFTFSPCLCLHRSFPTTAHKARLTVPMTKLTSRLASPLRATLLAVTSFASLQPPAFQSLCRSKSCSNLLIAVDGTGSRSWLDECATESGTAWTSHSHRFFTDYRGSKLFWHGPDAELNTFAAGEEVRSTVESAYAAICELNPETVDLVGHSRGGYAVMELARKLEATSCLDSKSKGRKRKPKLRFMGLYDPVSNVGTDVFGEVTDLVDFDDHSPMFGDEEYYKSSSMMPRNVELISIAYGDSALHSRWFFKTCLDSRDKHRANIDAADFRTTHGGIGGTPGKGDYDMRHLLDGHDIETEIEQAMSADLHIRRDALKQRVPIAISTKSDYENMRKCAIEN